FLARRNGRLFSSRRSTAWNPAQFPGILAHPRRQGKTLSEESSRRFKSPGSRTDTSRGDGPSQEVSRSERSDGEAGAVLGVDRGPALRVRRGGDPLLVRAARALGRPPLGAGDDDRRDRQRPGSPPLPRAPRPAVSPAGRRVGALRAPAARPVAEG